MKSNNNNYDEDAARMNPDGVVVPDEVYEGVEACRQSGEHNMFEADSVVAWCVNHDYYAAAGWVQETVSGSPSGHNITDYGSYGEAMMRGLCPESEANNDEGDA